MPNSENWIETIIIFTDLWAGVRVNTTSGPGAGETARKTKRRPRAVHYLSKGGVARCGGQSTCASARRQQVPKNGCEGSSDPVAITHDFIVDAHHAAQDTEPRTLVDVFVEGIDGAGEQNVRVVEGAFHLQHTVTGATNVIARSKRIFNAQ